MGAIGMMRRSSAIVAGSGDLLTIEALDSSSPEADLIVCRVLTVNGRQLPYKPLPSFVPLPSVPPDAESGSDVDVCGTDGDETNGREQLHTFSIRFWPFGDLGVPAGPFLVVDGEVLIAPRPILLPTARHDSPGPSPTFQPADGVD